MRSSTSVSNSLTRANIESFVISAVAPEHAADMVIVDVTALLSASSSQENTAETNGR